MKKKPKISYRDLASAPAAATEPVVAPAVATEPVVAAAVAPVVEAPAPLVRIAPAAVPTIVPRVQPALTFRQRAIARAGSVELLMFRVDGELFAVPLDAVEEALEHPDIRQVPEMPPSMLGVFPLRGGLTPAFSPTAALDVPLREWGVALIFRRERQRVAVVADDVEDVLTLDLSTLRQAPLSHQADDPVLGVARRGRELVAVLDPDLLLAACGAERAPGTALETA
ncbi:MAG: purine-binding chemotaxis protein CheW [Gemmatimonadetes bacterium]|nr:purine-binding chemotaxis protein CheW [Gemmatimonadota bacterium]